MSEERDDAKRRIITEKLKNIDNAVNTSVYNSQSIVDWQPLLAKECQVYVYGEGYLAKRFDQINFSFCSKDVAKEILTDNLYALLRFKYFKKRTDEFEEKIDKIIKSFTSNLKTTLIKVDFVDDCDCTKVKFIPNGCIAFRNGVFDFKNNRWLFSYNKIKIDTLNSTIYMYDPEYIVTWFVNLEFVPIGLNVNDFTTETFVEFLKELNKDNRNYCFELVYNMAHDFEDKFSYAKFEHLCEILGFLCYQGFVQSFVMLIGNGQNGKNSLIDGCFTSRVVSQPANIDLDSLEDDKFVTGALENKYHNIFLETDPNTKTKSKNLKALTGSPYQTIEHKGEDRRAGYINCKIVTAGNDQDKIKFSDNTVGFRRRANIFEVWYHWDQKKRFLKAGDYYDTSFSEDLSEIRGDIANTVLFIYLAMYGIRLATKDYTHSFKFNHNDWKLQYSDVNMDLRDKIEDITLDNVTRWICNPRNRESSKTLFYDLSKKCLYESLTLKEMGLTINNYDEFIRKFLKEQDVALNYFVEYDAYMSLRGIQEIMGNPDSAATFTQNVKKIYGIQSFLYLTGNKPYVKVRFVNNKLKIIEN